MIPQIVENFGAAAAYATLSNATIQLAEMGDRIITTQVKIDGDVVPDFSGWELTFRGEKFVLNVKNPQAAKDNTSINSRIDLTFYSWAILQLKRYFMFTVPATVTGVVTADKYNAPIALDIQNFGVLLNQVLTYYFHGKISVDVYSGATSEVVALEINYTKIWDVITGIHDNFGLRWRIEYVQNTDSYLIKIGYPSLEIDDHEFQYGYEGGLLRFERQVQSDAITNILLGRGGTRNVPYRYFKKTDPQNPDWTPDPDAIPELANVYIDRIRDKNFRSYVEGWKTNPHRDTTTWPGTVVETYDSTRGATDWAYAKGHSDETFDAVEYVKDDESIVKYGEHWGHLEDDDEIYPTIQGAILDGGRMDLVVGVSEIITDDMEGTADAGATLRTLDGVLSQTDDIDANEYYTYEIQGSQFTVPTGKSANLMDNGFFCQVNQNPGAWAGITIDTSQSSIKVYGASNNTEVSRSGIPAGSYYYKIFVKVRNSTSSEVKDVTYGVNGLYLQESGVAGAEWSPTFDIYVRNIFQSTQASGESDEDYALRVWGPVLGDHLGDEAAIAFSSGFMSISEDYTFKIAAYPTVDRTKSFEVDGTPFFSEWKITLYKSDAEYEATGLYIPNTTTGGKPVAGDYFYLLGVDMPFIYVYLAEQRLNAKKASALQDTADISPTWVVALDKVRMDDAYNEYLEKLFDKIDAGVLMHVSDPRFSGGVTLDLYASSVTFTWSDGTVILPETEVVLTDQISTYDSAIQSMQGQINVIRNSIAQIGDVEEVARQATRPLFLGKTGDDQRSLSPTRFASLLASDDFEQGDIGGKGWGFYKDNSQEYEEQPQQTRSGNRDVATNEPDKLSVMEVDKLIVRREMRVNSLMVNQITYLGGKQIISAASMECTQVVENSGSYDCYFDQKQGSVKNLFQVNDIVMGQVFTPENNDLRFYKAKVSSVHPDHIRILKSGKVGDGVPQKGDVIVQFGNTSDVDRQFVIIRDVIGGGYEQMLSGLNSTSAQGTEYYYAGHDTYNSTPTERWFVGNSNTNIEFNSARGGLFLKGTMVQSPSGATFPTPCFRGAYNHYYTYYYGDVVTDGGRSWMHIGQSATTGTDPSEGAVWTVYADKGADGGSAYRLDLTNENASINADANGNILAGAVRPTCTAKLYYGATAVPSGVTYAIASVSDNTATGYSIDSSTGVLTFNAGSASTPFNFSADSLELTITATLSGSVVATVIMTISKAKAGANGESAVSYWLVLTADKVSVDPNASPKVASPTTITPYAMKQVGDETPTAASDCTIKYRYNMGDTVVKPEAAITSGTAHTVLLEYNNTEVDTLYFTLYLGNKQMDIEAVPILYDGVNGTSPYRLDLTNENASINADSSGDILPGAIRPTCTAKLYLGTMALDSGVTYSAVPKSGQNAQGVSINSSTGVLTFNGGSDTTPFSFTGDSLEITVTASVSSSPVATAIMTVVKSFAGENGDDAVSYWLVLDTDKVSVDPNASTPAAVPAEITPIAMLQIGENAPRIAASGDNLSIKYNYDSETEQSLPGTGKITVALTGTGGVKRKTIHIYLYKTVNNVATLVDQESVPILYEGENGAAGASGKSMRGVSEWSSSGWNGSGEYQGETGTGDFIDAVTYPPASDNPSYYMCKETHNSANIEPEQTTGWQRYWEKMNNFQLIATRALVADQIGVKQIAVDNLNTGYSSGATTNRVLIGGNEIDVEDSTGANKVVITGGTLIGDSGSTGSFSGSSSYSGFSSLGATSFSATVFSGVQVASARNKASITSFTCRLECYASDGSTQVEIDDDASIFVYLENGDTHEAISLGQFSARVHNYASLVVDAQAVNLSAAPTYGYSLIVECQLLTQDNSRKMLCTVTTATLSGTYLAASAYETLIGGDGFKTIWNGEGLKVTTSGAKVIQGGTEYAALAGEGGIVRIKAVTAYPSTEEAGVLYIKVSSS